MSLKLQRPQPRPWPTLGAIIGLGILLSLGTWQLNRYHDKLDLEQTMQEREQLPTLTLSSLEDIDPKLHNYRKVRVRGTLHNAYSVLFKHRQHDKHPGYWIATPLALEGQDQYLLVNRGWIPRERGQDLGQAIATAKDPEPTTYEGLLHIPSQIIPDRPTRKKLDAGEITLKGGLISWSTYDLEAIQEQLPMPTPLDPTILVLGEEHSQDPFPIASLSYLTKPYMTSERHMSYFVFWYAMAAVLLAFYLASTFGLLSNNPKRTP